MDAKQQRTLSLHSISIRMTIATLLTRRVTDKSTNQNAHFTEQLYLSVHFTCNIFHSITFVPYSDALKKHQPTNLFTLEIKYYYNKKNSRLLVNL